MPLLISGIADYLEDPSDEITVHMPVVAKAMELGSLRHAQGFPVRQILWEYEILGGGVASQPGTSVINAASATAVATAVVSTRPSGAISATSTWRTPAG